MWKATQGSLSSENTSTVGDREPAKSLQPRMRVVTESTSSLNFELCNVRNLFFFFVDSLLSLEQSIGQIIVVMVNLYANLEGIFG